MTAHTIVIKTSIHSSVRLSADTYDLIVDSTGKIEPVGFGVAGVSATGFTNKAVSITNAGTILGGPGAQTGALEKGGNGVYLDVAGTIKSSGYIGGGTGGAGGGTGIVLAKTGSIVNAGTIAGGNFAYGDTSSTPDKGPGDGIEMLSGGVLKNTGTIIGGSTGIEGHKVGADYVVGGAGVVIDGGIIANYGTITGGYAVKNYSDNAGVLATVATIINKGVIEGGNCYYHAGGTLHSGNGIYLTSGLIINSGTIRGGDYKSKKGPEQDAASVFLSAGGTATLQIDPTGYFDGPVTAKGLDKIILAAGTPNTPGTLHGLGTKYTGFASVTETKGADWTLINASQFNGTIKAYGTLTLEGSLGSNGGTIIFEPTSDVTFSGGTVFGSISAGTVTVAGAVTLAAGGTLNALTLVDTSTLELSTGVTLATGADEFFEFAANTQGSGAPSLLGASGSAFNNAGALIASASKNANIGVSLTNTGTVSLDSGSLTFKDGVTNFGLIAGTANTQLYFEAGATLGGHVSSLGGMTLNAASTLMAGGTVAAKTLALENNLSLAGQSEILNGVGARLYANGAAQSIHGSGYIVSAGNFIAAAGRTISVGAGIVNTGTLTVENGASLLLAGNLTSTGGVSIAAAGMLDFNDLATGIQQILSGSVYGSGALQVYGTLMCSNSTTLRNAGGANNDGTIVVTSDATLQNLTGVTLSSGGAPATIDPGHRVNPNIVIGPDGTFMNDGTLAVAAGATAAVTTETAGASSGFFVNQGNLVSYGAAFAIGVSLTNTGSVALDSGSLTFSDAITSTGSISGAVNTQLAFQGATMLGGNVSSAGGVTLSGATVLMANATVASTALMLTNNLSLSGGAAITNGGGDVFYVSGVGGENIYGSGSIVSAGRFVAAEAGMVSVSADLVDTGTVTVENGASLSLDGALISTGGISIAATGLVAFYDPTTTSIQQTLSGAISGGGTLQVYGTVMCSADTSLGNTGGVADGGTIEVAANATLQTSAGITLNAANAAPSIDRGHRVNPNIIISQTGTFINGGGLTVANGGTATIGASTGGSPAVSGQFVNQGSIASYGASFTINASMLNNGTLGAISGLVTNVGSISGMGALNIGAAGTLQLEAGVVSSQTVDFLSSNSGTLSLYSSDLLSFNGIIKDFAGADIIGVNAAIGQISFNTISNVLTLLTQSGTIVAELGFYAGNHLAQANFSVTSGPETIISYKPS